MNTRSVVSILAASTLLGSRVASAACVISGVKPTVPLPTMERGQEFSFIATADCERLRFRVPGTEFVEIPKPGPDAGFRDLTYKVVLTEDEWNSLVDEGDTTFTWSIIGMTSAGVITRATTTNQLDVDRDGWTPSEGDVGACDHAPAINPGVAEICDGIDQDCDGLVDDNTGPWFRDADGDGYGDDADRRCDWADGYVDVGTDCDDTDSGLWCPSIDLALADAKLEGESIGDHAGWDVSGAGDVNSDGNDDVLVAARWNDEGGFYAGAAYLVLGPVTGTLDLAAADAKFIGEARGDEAASVSGAGDVDGDGNDDLLVGAYYNDEGGVNAGAAYLVLGPGTGKLDLGSADAKLVGQDWDTAGAALDGGDFDGDGHDDLLVGAPGHTDGVSSTVGAAYLVRGPVSGTLELSLAAAAELVGEAAFDGAGSSVSDAGDVDADGDRDLFVGGGGSAYLVLGPVSGTLDLALADAKLVGEEGADYGEVSIVSGAGDVNDDGHDDLLVGAYFYSAIGAAYVVYGPVSGTLDLSAADAKLMGEGFLSFAGESVSDAGDVDGDGYDDLLVGANSPASYLIRGPVSGTLDLGSSDLKFVGDETSKVSGAGDVDGDGRADMLFGSTNDNPGAAYLVLGASVF